MIKRFDGHGFPGSLERRYVVGTRKLNDAVTVILFTANKAPAKSREWIGLILRGILPSGMDDEHPDITDWFKRTNWLGEVVKWRNEECQVLFSVEEQFIPVLLRRMISRPADQVDLSKFEEFK